MLPLIIATTTASLRSYAVDQSSALLARHPTGCSQSTTWQNGAENSTARACNNGTGLFISNTNFLVNKTDCQALVQKLISKAGTGHWDVQWDCDEGSPDRLDYTGTCGFMIDKVTATTENT